MPPPQAPLLGHALPYPARWLGEQLARSRIDLGRGVGQSPHPAGWKNFKPHGHPDYDLHVVLRGHAEYGYPNRTVKAPEGSLVLHPPRVPFEERDTPRGRGTLLVYAHFQCSVGGGLDPLRALDLPLAARPAGLKRVRALCRAMVREVRARQAGDPLAHLRAKSAFLELFTLLLETALRRDELRMDPKRIGPAWLWTALEMLDRRLARPELSVEDLAKRAHLSASHFAHEFQRYVGVAPMRLLLQKRIERACDLLAGDPQMTVKEVAARCGFTDPYHFSAQFKRAMHLSPSDWRRGAAR